MSKLTVVGLSGSLSRPSRTSALVSAVLNSIQELEDVNIHWYDLADVGLGLFAASSFDRLNAESREIIEDMRGPISSSSERPFTAAPIPALSNTSLILCATTGCAELP